MGIGACTLGYADHDVDEAVKKAVDEGSMCTLNAPEEPELAELLLRLHPWAEMVRYARTGGEAMAVAVRTARASIGKDIVLFCGYHGWSDWYLAANLADDGALDGQLLPGLEPLGVPRGLKGTAFPFSYNNTAEFLRLMAEHGKDTGAVILEPVRNIMPEKEFLETIKRETARAGIPLIVDEVSAGFRMNLGGAHIILGIEPDIAVFAKGMSNGYPMAAVIGKSAVMDSVQKSFISSTYWTERTGPAAALATIRKMEAKNVQVRLMECGKKVQAGWNMLAEKHGLKLHVGSIYPLSHFDFGYPNPQVLKTLFIQLMLERGFLASLSYYSSYAHEDGHIEAYLDACDGAFAHIARALESGTVERELKGPVCQAGFKRIS